MTEAALLAAILADPDDDAPRLIMSDWLGENGQGERAEFIRVQIALAGPCCAGADNGRNCTQECDGHAALRRREAELTGAAARWHVPEDIAAVCVLSEDVVTACRTRFLLRRGFVAAVTCPAEDWLKHADAMLAAQPVEEVRLTTRPRLAARGTSRGTVYRLAAVGGHEREAVSTAGPEVHAAITVKLLHSRWPRVRRWHLPTADPRRTVHPTPVRY